MSLRQLRVLVENLPPDGAVGRAVRGHPWLDANYQLADVADIVNQLLAVTVAVHSERGRYKAPKPYPRPGASETTERQERAAGQAVTYLETYRSRKGA